MRRNCLIGFTFGGQQAGGQQGPQGLQSFGLHDDGHGLGGHGLGGGQHIDGHGFGLGQQLEGHGSQHGSHDGIGQQLGSQEISQHIIGGQHGSHISGKRREGKGMLVPCLALLPPSVLTLAFLEFLEFFSSLQILRPVSSKAES